MLNVFSYTDYRKYLLDYYQEKKKDNQTFSYNSFSIKAGFRNKGFLHTVLHGSRNLSKSSIVKIVTAIGLKKSEAEYFENLVFFNQAIDLIERTYFCEKLNSVRTPSRSVTVVQQTRRDQYEFYSRWYHSAIRSLIDMYPFKNDYLWLAKNVFPAITPKQAKRSVELLAKLGLIEKKKDGVYALTSKNITTGNEITAVAALQFHKESAHLVEHALDTLPRDKRNVTGLTLGISENMYNKICDEITAFRTRIVNMVQDDVGTDRTYQLNFHFFPITNVSDRR
ncbi:MAG: TIGR02147 family protein [Chitinispirillaceae bacterium]|jgi:uncharacterized protein (TIGR02147 family)